MKSLAYAALAALASTATAAPAVVEPRQGTACSTPVTLTGNAFASRTLHPNSFYRSEVEAAAAAMSDSSLAAKARKVANVGSFIWMDTRDNIARVESEIAKVPCGNIFGVVVYDLPGRDCAAKASNGELAVGSLNTYKTEYIDRIVKMVKANPNVAIAAVIEPDSLPNLVTNSKLQTCQQSASGYREGVAYALKNLNLPNVVMYIDAGHGGWLGWNDNLKPGAKEIADAWKRAGNPKQVMGIASNVAGWNAWKMKPGEFEDATDAQWNKAQDEQRYIDLFAPELKNNGMPNHAIIDTGRNGVQGLREEWGNWCNVNGAGFGVRPTSNTGHNLVDAFVWVKPGGESDGTSDTSAVRYDSFCGKPDAFKPAPEAGTWNQAYFEMLLQNANPSF